MKTKIIQFVPAILALSVIGFSNFSQWCTSEGHVCFRTVLDRMIPEVTYPLYFFSLFSLSIFLVVAFVPRSIFNSWRKFAVWALPLVFMFIATTPVNFTGIGMDFFPFYRDDAARLLGSIFAVASLTVLAFSAVRSHFYGGRDEGDMKRETVELEVLFIAGIGLVSSSIAVWFSSAPIRGALHAFIVIGGISILTTLYALGRASILSYKKTRVGASIGWKILVTFLLTGMTIVTLFGGVLLG